MKESNNEGVAIHVGPESWAGTRKGHGQALTGGHVSWAIELRKPLIPGAQAIGEAEGNTDEAGQHRQQSLKILELLHRRAPEMREWASGRSMA